jgi:hypothetical protein
VDRPHVAEQVGDGQARSRFELIDFRDSNLYSAIEAALPDRAAMPQTLWPKFSESEIINMEDRDYIEELKGSMNFNDPKYIDGLVEGLNAAFYIAQEAGIDLYKTPKFVELQDFVLKHSKGL